MRIDTVVVSTQHTPRRRRNDEIRKFVINKIIKPVLPNDLVDGEIKYHINPTGRFVVGGPHGDCGLTGRKIIVDTYGGWGRHGGGAFSGKDPTKVDRSAAYMARYVAKNIVAAGLADRCEVQLAYAIGVSEPVSVYVDTEGTGKIDDDRICELVREFFPLTPERHHQVPRPASADLPQDGRRRPLRPQRAGVHLGKDRQGQATGRGRRDDGRGNVARRRTDNLAASHGRHMCAIVTALARRWRARVAGAGRVDSRSCASAFVAARASACSCSCAVRAVRSTAPLPAAAAGRRRPIVLARAGRLGRARCVSPRPTRVDAGCWLPSASLLLFAVGCSYPGSRVDRLAGVAAGDCGVLCRARMRSATAAARRASVSSSTSRLRTSQLLQQLTRVAHAPMAAKRSTARCWPNSRPASGSATLLRRLLPAVRAAARVEAEVADGPDADVKIVQVLHNGAQLEVRLAQPADSASARHHRILSPPTPA